MRLRDIHDRDVIHRDIKPENFMFPVNAADEISTINSPNEAIDFHDRNLDLSKIEEEDMEDSPSQPNSKEDACLLCDDVDYFASRDLYLIDFGLAQFYIDEKTGQHLEDMQNMNFVGTTNFSSKHSHKLRQQSRRDDIEAVANVAVYLYKGKLPWFQPLARTMDRRKRYEQISKWKEETDD